MPGLQPIVLTDQDVADEVAQLCRQLRAARRTSRLTVRAAAAAASVAPFTVTRVEAGSATPSLATFAKLAAAAGHTVGVRHQYVSWGETSRDLAVAPWWLPRRGSRWWDTDLPDHPMWLRLSALGSELWWSRQWSRWSWGLPAEVTEADAARLLGMSRTTVRGIEGMAGDPLLSTVIQLANLTTREVGLRPVAAPRPITEWEYYREALETAVAGPVSMRHPP